MLNAKRYNREKSFRRCPMLGAQRSIVPQLYDIFAGLDVDKKSIAATFTDHQGLVKSLKIPYDPQPLVHYVQRYFPGKKVAFAYEAGPTGFGLHQDLVAAGHPCLVL